MRLRTPGALGRQVPTVAAAISFVSGATLLLTGLTPLTAARLHSLAHALPLPVVEISQFAAGILGVGLLVLARGLHARLDGAFFATLGFLAVGAGAAVLRGFQWEEALLLVGAMALLAPCRAAFYRQSSLLHERFRMGWWIGAASVVVASAVLAFLSLHPGALRGDLWWRFALDQDVPRALRGLVVSAAALIGFGTARLLAPAGVRPTVTEAELDRARPLVASADRASAHLALLGDKTLLFDPGQEGFLMYAVEGRTWVALGDPVGPGPVADALAWEFRAQVDRHHGWTCFYEVSARALPRYLDLGLTLRKVGEEAIVALADFSLDGAARAPLRQSVRKVEKEAVEFEIVPAERVAPLLPELRVISDAWLGEKARREKGFSIGFFNARYLGQTPLACVRSGGRIVAFANLWAPACRSELSIDLMRSTPDAPRSVMDYLFVQLMLWGRAEGFARFSLGGAPFSGLEERPLAPAWHRWGGRLFRHGGRFYNFQGVRQFKEKFRPQWEPRYLASPAGLALPRILASIAAIGARAGGASEPGAAP